MLARYDNGAKISHSHSHTPQTADEIKVGRQLGAQVAANLVRKFLDMGMPAQRAGQGPPPQLGDVLITGQFISIEEGDRAKRIFIGFGKGSSELQTHVEGYLVARVTPPAGLAPSCHGGRKEAGPDRARNRGRGDKKSGRFDRQKPHRRQGRKERRLRNFGWRGQANSRRAG